MMLDRFSRGGTGFQGGASAHPSLMKPCDEALKPQHRTTEDCHGNHRAAVLWYQAHSEHSQEETVVSQDALEGLRSGTISHTGNLNREATAGHVPGTFTSQVLRSKCISR